MSLSLRDGLELSLLASSKVDVHWNQFYTYLFALLAWLSSNLSTIGLVEATIITVATVAFVGLNMIGTIRAYVILDLFVDETNHIARASNFGSKRVRKYIGPVRRRMGFPLRMPITILGHLLAGGAILYLTWKPIVGMPSTWNCPFLHALTEIWQKAIAGL